MRISELCYRDFHFALKFSKVFFLREVANGQSAVCDLRTRARVPMCGGRGWVGVGVRGGVGWSGSGHSVCFSVYKYLRECARFCVGPDQTSSLDLDANTRNSPTPPPTHTHTHTHTQTHTKQHKQQPTHSIKTQAAQNDG